MAEDYYQTLGVERSASADDILKAYRKLARKYHPDVNKEASAKDKFKKVQHAFDVLNSPEQRALYDRHGEAFEQFAGGGGGPGPGPRPGGRTYGWSSGTGGPSPGAGGFGADFDLNDLFGGRANGGNPFSEFFTQGRSGGGPRQHFDDEGPDVGDDLHQQVAVPFRTAVLGGKLELTIRRQSGKQETVEVKIPPGMEDGRRIRLRGQGNFAPNGLSPGDLILTIHVEPHKWFTRKGDDLHVKLPISLGEAVEGAKVDVPTPAGSVSLRIPPGTSSGAKLRVKGQGAPRKDGTAGDLFAEVLIKLPADLSPEDAAELVRIDAEHPQNPRQDLTW